jgi:hypothetical protein
MPRCARARQDLKDVWRERVQMAADAFEKAKKLAAEEFQRCTASAQASEEDFQQLKEAQKAEMEALTKYMKVLKTFHNLVVSRKDPTG